MRWLAGGVVAALMTTTLAAAPADAVKPNSPQHISDWRGVNWPVPDDNYQAGPLVLSGLSIDDSYQQVYAFSTALVKRFDKVLGTNTVRLPVNPWSVGTKWWKSYKATIDAATALGDKVIVSYWDKQDANDGKIDNRAKWNKMWNTLVHTYRKNDLVYFDLMNEPYGYGVDEWIKICATWLKHHPRVPRGRVILAGSLYDMQVSLMGDSPKLKGTLLEFHYYQYWTPGITTRDEWMSTFESYVGKYASRTIIGEVGTPMTGDPDPDYSQPDSGADPTFFDAITSFARSNGMGIVYWPGYRTNDDGTANFKSLLVSPDPANPKPGKLVVANQSALDQLRWSWGYKVSTAATTD